MANNQFDVVIVGGSYSGLSAAMALGRSMRKVLVIDDGKPCNLQTPHSHNFITHDGHEPVFISSLAKKQVLTYPTVEFLDVRATSLTGSNNTFIVKTNTEREFSAKKVLFATGMKDIMPPIKGFAECWGISILHCPYCHGYEVRNMETGIIADGNMAFEFTKMINNWTPSLTLFTNGKHNLSEEQLRKLEEKKIRVNENEILEVVHEKGDLRKIIFKDGSFASPKAVYAKPEMIQACELPAALKCQFTDSGHILVDDFQKTTVPGIYAAGDNCSFFRAVSIAIASGTKAGALINKELVDENF